MSEKITDYIEVSTLPTDTLFDVSIDVDTTPKTRSISKANLSSELGLFYSSDGTISDALRTVTVNDSLMFQKGRVGFGIAPLADESVVIRKRGAGDSCFIVKGGLSEELFKIHEFGFVSIGGATNMTGVDKLGVNGVVSTSSVMSVGGAPVTDYRFTMIDNYKCAWHDGTYVNTELKNNNIDETFTISYNFIDVATFGKDLSVTVHGLSGSENRTVLADTNGTLMEGRADYGNLTTAEITALLGMPTGAIVFDTTLAQFFGYDGTTWNLLG